MNIERNSTVIVTKRSVVNGYQQWVEKLVYKHWEPSLVTFMFNETGSRERYQQRTMLNEVERTYSYLLTRIVRRPRSQALTRLPLWIGSFDYPIPKWDKDSFRDIVVNGGLHVHVVALTPPWSRIAANLTDVIETRQEHLTHGNTLLRIHSVPIKQTPKRVVDYTMKAIKKGRLEMDSTIVLPQRREEIIDQQLRNVDIEMGSQKQQAHYFNSGVRGPGKGGE